MTVHRFTDFVPQDYYEASGFSNTSAVAQDGLIAESGSVEIYRESFYIHGRSSEFTTDLTDAIAAYRVANGAGSETIFDDRVDRRVTYDASGNCYTLVTVGETSTPEQFMLLSDDDGATWEAFLLPGNRQWARIEFNDSSTRITATPPAVLLFNTSGLLEVVLPVLSAGALTFDVVVEITASNSLLVPQHSGAGNSVVTVGADTVLVAWPHRETPDPVGGTNQYISVVSRSGESVTSTTLMGKSNSTQSPDDHDAPAITVDSSDVCHCILGSHHGDLYYTSSSSPYTTWAGEETVAAKHPTGGGHSYMALVIDSNDDLHVVTRNADGIYDFKLSYYKRTSGTWSFVEHLVVPGRTFYAIYYHSLSILEDDTLVFTSPGHLPAQIYAVSEFPVYDSLFPGELVNTPDGGGRIPFQSTQKPHFPMVFFSSDLGSSWTKTSLTYAEATAVTAIRTRLDQLIAALSPIRDYRFQEASGTTTEDFGSNGVDLTHPSGIILAADTDIFNLKCADYSGTTGVSDGTAFVAVDIQTIMLLIKTPSSTNPGALTYVMGNSGNGTTGQAVIFNTTGTIRITHYDAAYSDIRTFISTNDVYDGQWHWFTFVVNHASGVTAYMDDASLAGANSAAGLAASLPLNVGGRYDGNSSFAGQIARLVVINGAVTLTQIEGIVEAYLSETSEIVRGRNLWTGKRFWNGRA